MSLRIALAQINTVVGDFDGNRRLVLDAVARAREMGVELVVAPELALVGYPPRDLLERGGLVAAAAASLDALVETLDPAGPALVVGSVVGHGALPRPRNVAILVSSGTRHVVAKRLLPTYDVFDEQRHFSPGPADQPACFEIAGVRVGILVCEDQWTDPRLWGGARPYEIDPAGELARAGAELIVNLSASPFAAGKLGVRAMLAGDTARREGVGVALCNLVGGNDALIFDGGSLCANADGQVAVAGPRFASALVAADFHPGRRRFEAVGPAATADRTRASLIAPAWPDDTPLRVHTGAEMLDELEDALVLGLRDYAGKLGFESAVLGLSGGVDSALVAYLAARALGGEAVHAVEMPSRYTAPLSRTIAAELIAGLGLQGEVIDIEPTFEALTSSLAPAFGARGPDLTEENLQSRIRGTLLMALSNKRGHLVLATGNKSEMAVGYCTLYGDMNGGLAVISDLLKLQVYAMCERINARAGHAVIPEAVILRPPSAELRADQRDDDSLPPYPLLDRVLTGILVDRLEDAPIAAALGVAPGEISRVRAMVDRAEFKRFQAAPTLKVSPKAWQGRRYPIVHRFRGFDPGGPDPGDTDPDFGA